MSDTAAAVEAAVTEAFSPPTEAPAPAIVRREDVREQIMNAEWKEDAELAAPADAPAPDAPAQPDTRGEEGESSLDVSEPPPEAVIGEGGNRVIVRTADGKYAAAPDVKLEFAVGDKVYLKSPADLVRMAKDGVAGQQFRQEVQQYREQVPQMLERYQAMEAELEAQRALNLEILNDETAYLERRDEWTQLNAPEARLARMEQQQQQEYAAQRAREEQARQLNVVATYFEENIKPIQEEILDGYQQVSYEAKLGRISLDTAPLMQNGVIPPHNLPTYAQYLAGPFREWLRAEAAKVDQMQALHAQQQQQQMRQQQQQAQRAVQQVGRQMAPTGRAGADVPPPAPKPRNREEAKAMIINRAWQDV